MRSDPREGISSPSGDLGEDLLQIAGMLENSAALISIYDESERLMYSNHSFREVYDVGPGEHPTWQELMRHNFEAKRGINIKSDNIDAWIAAVRASKGKSRVRSYEAEMHNGSFLWVVETTLENGWIIFVGTDVTSLNESQRKLRLSRDSALRASTIDELTGISNRRHILAQLTDLLDPATVGVPHFGVACLVDIDFFKSINDQFGHQAGDDALIAFTGCINSVISLRDSLGRVGGEEFLILFPRQTQSQAMATMSSIREAVAKNCRVADHDEIRLTFSAGMSVFHANDSVNDVLKRCDQALYAAKNGGRDQVCAYCDCPNAQVADERQERRRVRT